MSSSIGGVSICFCFRCRKYLLKTHANTKIAMAPTATPTPTPAFAPVLSPETVGAVECVAVAADGAWTMDDMVLAGAVAVPPDPPGLADRDVEDSEPSVVGLDSDVVDASAVDSVVVVVNDDPNPLCQVTLSLREEGNCMIFVRTEASVNATVRDVDGHQQGTGDDTVVA